MNTHTSSNTLSKSRKSNFYKTNLEKVYWLVGSSAYLKWLFIKIPLSYVCFLDGLRHSIKNNIIMFCEVYFGG